MTASQMRKCRERLEQFLADLLEPVGRRERRHWGSLYVRGLLLNGERKSIEPMAARLPEGNVQALQQFVGQSPWGWDAVWERLGSRMTAELEPDAAWVVDDTGFPKQGHHSVGVERQYSGTLGKTGNCQVAVSLHHVGEQGHAVLGWRLYLPEGWAADEQRREQAGVPPEVTFRPKWQLALDLVDQVRSWDVPARVVIADAGYGEVTEFRAGLEARALPYVVGVSAKVGVWTQPPGAEIPPTAGGVDHPNDTTTAVKDRPRWAKWPGRPKDGRRCGGGRAPKDGWRRASWRCGCGPPMDSCVASRRTRKSGY